MHPGAHAGYAVPLTNKIHTQSYSVKYFRLELFLKGDRMWQFGIGLFLVELKPESLQLVAIYGFISGAATLLLSTLIGDWVDRTARLKGNI